MTVHVHTTTGMYDPLLLRTYALVYIVDISMSEPYSLLKIIDIHPFMDRKSSCCFRQNKGCNFIISIII